MKKRRANLKIRGLLVEWYSSVFPTAYPHVSIYLVWFFSAKKFFLGFILGCLQKYLCLIWYDNLNWLIQLQNSFLPFQIKIKILISYHLLVHLVCWRRLFGRALLCCLCDSPFSVIGCYFVWSTYNIYIIHIWVFDKHICLLIS